MCDFLSGLVLLDERVVVRNMTSHSATVAALNLPPGTYREFEWTGEDEGQLKVRTESEDIHDENWYRACVLAHGNTRSKFIKLVVNQPDFVDWAKKAESSLDLRGLTTAEGLKLPDSVGGKVILSEKIKMLIKSKK